MYVRKLLKNKEPIQGRIRRPWNAWGAGSDEGSREISFSSSSESSSETCTSRVATVPPLNFSKQLVRSLTSSDVSDSFLKSFSQNGLKKQMSASRIVTQAGSPSSGTSSESRRAHRLRPGKRIDVKKKKSESCPPSKSLIVSSSSSYLIESSQHETCTDSASSSQSVVVLHDESEVSESSSTQENYTKEERKNIEKIDCVRTSSPDANEEALVLQLKIPSWSAQHRLESLDVEYLVFKVPAMKTV